MILGVVFLQVGHPNKIAVGGHSYGAFMTANLLAHAPHLFSCGIARSGAYNRTLTPFGFQVGREQLFCGLLPVSLVVSLSNGFVYDIPPFCWHRMRTELFGRQLILMWI